MDEVQKRVNIFEETMAHMTYVQIEEAAGEALSCSSLWASLRSTDRICPWQLMPTALILSRESLNPSWKREESMP